VLFNLEGDSALVVTAMFQGTVAALMLAYLLGAFRRRKRPIGVASDPGQ
jgi:hypothetical protein